MLELPDFNLARLGIYVSYSTGENKEEWSAMEMEEAKERIRKEIDADSKLRRQIGRYAEREGQPVDTAMNMVLERMYVRKTN